MKLNPDYADMFKILNTAGVKYLVVGAYALGYYVKPLPFPVGHFIIDRVSLCGRRVKLERSADKFSVWIDGN